MVFGHNDLAEHLPCRLIEVLARDRFSTIHVHSHTPLDFMTPDLLLTVDVGNTRAKLGLFDRNSWSPGVALPPCLATLALPLAQPIDLKAVADQLAAAHGSIKGTSIAGVNPPGIDRLLAGWPAIWPRPRRITSFTQLTLDLDVETPERVGIDRLLGAVATNRLRNPGQGAIVVDSGTATTVNLITPTGTFSGGAILPGLALGGLALNHYTAMLPHVPASELVHGTISPAGKNTWDAIRSGVLYGQVGAIRELSAQLTSTIPEATAPPLCLITGGAGALLARYLGSPFRFERHLPLYGLAITIWGHPTTGHVE